MLLSVIIPVYNSAPYLRKCVGSVCAAPVQEMEIICVNDGATDGSDAMLREMAADDSRIRVIDRKNGGVSAARNTGLQAAKGEYLCFIDDDDSVEPDYLPNLLAAAQAHPTADCIISGYTRCENDTVTPHSVCTQTTWVEGLPPLAATITVWGKLYKTEVLRKNDICFAEEVRYGEDTLFNHMCFPLCRGLLLCPSCGYMYYDRAGSISTHRKTLVTDMAKATEILAAYLNAHSRAQLCEAYLTAYAAHSLRRIRSMAPHGMQHPCTQTVRTALQQLNLTPNTLPPTLSAKNRALLQKVLCGSNGLGPGYYWKRFSRLVKQWIRK